MQYAAVWMADGSGIIQIGMEPRRVFEEMEKKSLSGMIANMPSVNYGDFLIIDAQSETIVAATADELIGRDVSEALDKIKSGKNLSVYHYRFGGKKYCVYVRAYEDYIYDEELCGIFCVGADLCACSGKFHDRSNYLVCE